MGRYDAVKMQLKMDDNYGYAELMELGRLTYVNLVDNGILSGRKILPLFLLLST